MNKIKDVLKDILNKITRKHQMKIYFYAKGHCIASKWVKEDEKPFENVYLLNVWFRKYLMGSNYCKIVVKPSKVKYATLKSIHIETELFMGGEV